MATDQHVLEYKCPCCGAGLVFGDEAQKMTCQYCDNEFELDAVKAYNATLTADTTETFEWDGQTSQEWSESEQEAIRKFTCPACGGEILTDANTAATFCPYCENPAILQGRLTGSLKPDGVIPFKTSKEDAQKAFLNLCKGKPLLPKDFASQQRIEKISGVYVPFWLYDCNSSFNGTYQAARVHHWSDSRYNYTRTEHFLLTRGAKAAFSGIPMDASSKMDNTIMESIEPFDYTAMVDFETAYLSGFLADKYDVESSLGKERIRQRVDSTIHAMLQPTLAGYATAIPSAKTLNVTNSKAKYVLLPVWMLHSKYKDKTYVFAMNGQTGKMTGTFPICGKRSVAWFSGVCAGVTVLVTLLQMLFR